MMTTEMAKKLRKMAVVSWRSKASART